MACLCRTLALSCLLLIPLLSVPAASAQEKYDLRTVAIVTLYSDGKRVGRWEAIDRGRHIGNCYVFHIKKGVREPEVRVCGTFVVEEVR